jgi:hypothetical protein
MALVVPGMCVASDGEVDRSWGAETARDHAAGFIGAGEQSSSS